MHMGFISVATPSFYKFLTTLTHSLSLSLSFSLFHIHTDTLCHPLLHYANQDEFSIYSSPSHALMPSILIDNFFGYVVCLPISHNNSSILRYRRKRAAFPNTQFACKSNTDTNTKCNNCSRNLGATVSRRSFRVKL